MIFFHRLWDWSKTKKITVTVPQEVHSRASLLLDEKRVSWSEFAVMALESLIFQEVEEKKDGKK